MTTKFLRPYKNKTKLLDYQNEFKEPKHMANLKYNLFRNGKILGLKKITKSLNKNEVMSKYSRSNDGQKMYQFRYNWC